VGSDTDGARLVGEDFRRAFAACGEPVELNESRQSCDADSERLPVGKAQPPDEPPTTRFRRPCEGTDRWSAPTSLNAILR
jgi:hypothetical protein